MYKYNGKMSKFYRSGGGFITLPEDFRGVVEALRSVLSNVRVARRWPKPPCKLP